MSAVLPAIGILLVLAFGIACVLWRDRAIRAEWMREVADARTEDLREALRERAAHHAAQIDAMAAFSQNALQMLTLGGPPGPATREDPPPDAEDRLMGHIQQETIAAGAAAISARYAERGMPISEQQAIEQAMAFLNEDVGAIDRLGGVE